MKIYNYHFSTKEYLGSSQADKSPLDDGYLIPANATEIKPPKAQKGKAICFDEEHNKWVFYEDHRGEVYYGGEDGRKEIIIDFLGDPAKHDLLAEPKSLPFNILKEKASINIKEFASSARSKIAGTSDPFKLTEYADKASLAPKILDGSASKDALQTASEEAKSLGLKDAKALAAIWQEKADFLRSARLLVNQQEKEALKAIENSKSEEEINELLGGFKEKAEEALKGLMGV